MAARASLAVHNEVERKAADPKLREGFFPQASPPGDGVASSSLSARQKKLLAGFGVLQSGQLQRRLASVADEVKRQDVPARSNSQVPKEVASSPLTRNFTQPYRISTSPAEYNMALGSFDPFKYGAPPKKQKLAVPAPSQHVPIKTTAPEVASPEATPMPVQNQISNSVAQSTVSEASNHAVSFQTQATEVPDATKKVEANAAKPKSTNHISIPGFDPSRYGKSNVRKRQSFAQDDVSVNTGSEACETILQTSDPSINVHAPSISLQDGPASIVSTSYAINRSQGHAGDIKSSPGAANDDNTSNRTSSSTVSNIGTVLRGPHTQIISSRSPATPYNMVPSSLPPPGPPISKEERLRQVKQAAMREIGIRNRFKGGATETTSLRDLQLAQAPVLPESSLASTAALPPPKMKESPPKVASTIGTPQTARSHKSASVLGTSSSILPPALPGMSKHDHLKQVQQARLREIGIRNRGDGRDSETTSLIDLNLARTPVRSETLNSAAAPSPSALGQAAGLISPQEPPTQTAVDNLNTGEIQDRVAAFVPSNLTLNITRNPRWCTNEELRPQPNLESDSNAWGSDIPSNGSVASNDSTRPMQLQGRLFKGPPAAERDDIEALVGWDGKMQPPPVDWNDRPRFNNNSLSFKNVFNNWFATAASDCYEFVDRTPMFKQIPYHLISNVEWHADGIAMIRKEYTLNVHNISKYGYDTDPADVAKYAEEITTEDFEDWGKLDMSEPDNVKFKDETTEQLVNNWRIHYENSRKNISLAIMPGHKATKASKVPKPEINPNEPSLNIYIRPAVKGDVKQMTDLYNWWVENSVRPVEVRPVSTADMGERFDISRGDDRLPFVVAILKGKKDVPRDFYTGVKGEQVVGFALATGFTAADYVEHIAAELEIYVHHKFLRQGIGRCLLDRLMCATDRGYMERGGYPFHCDPAERHWYEVGGARDLHKLMFVARHHSRPKKDHPEEVDVTTWMKKWLVKDWDFEQEACLKQTGAKNGRFLDVTYFSKFSKWLPEDGRVPGPEPKDHRHAMLG